MRDAPATSSRLLLGLSVIVGALIGLVTHEALALPVGWFRVTWILFGVLLGLFCGWLLDTSDTGRTGRASSGVPESDAAAPAVPDDLGTREGGTSVMQFLAIARGTHSGELRPLRVAPHSVPAAPPITELRLLVEAYDQSLVLAEPSSEEPWQTLVGRVAELLVERAPPTPREVRLDLVSADACDEVGPDGRCGAGWHIEFVDGGLGLVAHAWITGDGSVLTWASTSSFHRPRRAGRFDPGACMALARTSGLFPDDARLSLSVRFPADVIVWQRHPLRIAEIDPEAPGIRNDALLRGLRPSLDDVDLIRLSALRQWLHGGDADHDAGLERMLTQDGIREGLRTLKEDAYQRVAAAIDRREGTRVARELIDAIETAEDAEEQVELLHLLAWLPCPSAMAGIHRLAVDLEGERARSLARNLAFRRRSGEIAPAHPASAAGDFVRTRAAMGKGEPVILPLRSTYDPERVLLQPLQDLGLRLERTRHLSGDANLLLGAWLRAPGTETEAIVASTPVPIPCHILHLVGRDAEEWRRRIEQRGLTLTDAKLDEDLKDRSLHKVHRGALYLAALRRDAGPRTGVLIDAFTRGRADINLRRAVLLALSHASDPEARRLLRSACEESGEIGTLARTLCGRGGAAA